MGHRWNGGPYALYYSLYFGNVAAFDIIRDPQISIFTIVFLVKIFVVFKISCRPSPATSLIQQTFSPSVFLVRGKFSLRQSISAMADKENPPKELPQEPPVLPHQRFAGPGKYIL